MKRTFHLISVIAVFMTMQFSADCQEIKGTVLDGETSIPLSYVHVYFAESQGTFTDEEGSFAVPLELGDSLRFSLIGYDDYVIATTDIESPLVVNLNPTAIGLDVVEISGKSENLGKKLIKRLIAQKAQWEALAEDYSIDCYRRSLTNYYFEPGKQDTIDTIAGWKPGALFEEYATHYIDGRNYKKVVTAELNNVSADQLKARSRFNVDESFAGANMVISYNPVDVFLQPEQIFFSQYDNVWENTNISDRPISNLLSDLAFATYRFTLSEIDVSSGRDTIFTVKVEPRFKESASFSGTLLINGATDQLIASDLMIDNGLVSGLRNLTVKTDYKTSGAVVYPSNHEITYDYRIGKDKYQVSTNLVFTDRVEDPEVAPRFYNNEVVTYATDALDRDLDKWSKLRGIALDSTLIDYVVEQDSIYEYEHSVEYYRIQDSIYNDNSIIDYLFRGFGWKKRSIGLTTSIDPLISMIQLNFIGGVLYNFGGRVEKEFLNANKLQVGGFINYGPLNDEFKGRLSTSFTYSPKRFARVYGGVEDIYDIITEAETFEAIISPRNIINVRSATIGHAFEVVNGLYLDASLQFAIKKAINNQELPEWNEIFGQFGEPLDFKTYRAMFANFEIIYRFNQRFITRGPRKLLLSNHSPAIKLTYRYGIPSIFGSEVNFNQLTLDVYQQAKPTRLGTTNWRVTSGIFANKKSIRDIENVYFRGENLVFFSDPLKNLQRLDATLNTNDPYVRAGLIHHFDGFFLDKVPLINKLQMEVIGGTGGLALSDRDYGQLELYVGIGKKFKLFKETVQVAVYRMSAIDTNNRRKGGFVIGFNLYDAFNGQWLY